MQIKLNGDGHEVRDGISIADLLGELGIEDRNLAVEHNREFVDADRFSTTLLRDGDALEIVRFVGGG